MKLNDKQTQVRQRVSKLESLIQDAVDTYCKEEKYSVHYTEIQCALIRVMKTINGCELRSLWEDVDDENNELK